MNPMDYSLCCQCVTVYRKLGAQVLRKVVDNACLSYRAAVSQQPYGKSMEKTFLLIIPGNTVTLQPGDRIYNGIGPETVDWQTFLPVRIPELFEASYGRPCCWEGETVHWEAGNRKENL